MPDGVEEHVKLYLIISHKIRAIKSLKSLRKTFEFITKHNMIFKIVSDINRVIEIVDEVGYILFYHFLCD